MHPAFFLLAPGEPGASTPEYVTVLAKCSTSVVRTTDLYTEGGDALDLARREEREYREYLSDE